MSNRRTHSSIRRAWLILAAGTGTPGCFQCALYSPDVVVTLEIQQLPTGAPAPCRLEVEWEGSVLACTDTCNEVGVPPECEATGEIPLPMSVEDDFTNLTWFGESWEPEWLHVQLTREGVTVLNHEFELDYHKEDSCGGVTRVAELDILSF